MKHLLFFFFGKYWKKLMTRWKCINVPVPSKLPGLPWLYLC